MAEVAQWASAWARGLGGVDSPESVEGFHRRVVHQASGALAAHLNTSIHTRKFHHPHRDAAPCPGSPLRR